MLQYIEKSFKESLRRPSQSVIVNRKGSIVNEDAEMDCSPAQDSPSSTVSGSNSNTCELSFSFRIELGKNETEKKAAMERYQEFQTWMWKECFDSSTLRAMRDGEKRCRPLMGICDFCLDSYMVESELCPSCYRPFGTFDNMTTPSEQLEDKRKISPRNNTVSKASHPLRIRLLKALLTFVEVRNNYFREQFYWNWN